VRPLRAWQIYFRHNFDVSLTRVVKNLPNVVRRVEERPIALGVHFRATIHEWRNLLESRTVFGRGGTHRTACCKFRICGNVEPPALILCQMPMEHVQLVHRHEIEHLTHGLLSEEVPPLVKQNAAPAIRRRVHNLHARIVPSCIRLLGELP